MDFEIEQSLKAELSSRERLLWSGIPAQGLRLQPSDAFGIPFSLVWAGFVVFWELNVVTMNAPLLFKLWGIPFVVAGLYLVIGRFFVDAYQRGRTSYGLTNERVIIVQGLFSREVKSLALSGLHDISLKERSDASGTISFGRTSALSFGAWPGANRRAPPAFEGVPDARHVYTLIRDAQVQQLAN